MSDRATEAPSLRRLLFLWLALPLTGVLMFAAAVFYPIGAYSVRTGYDHALMDTAHSLARLTPMLAHRGSIVSDDADIVLRLDQYDRVYYSVHDAAGVLLAGDAQLTAPPPGMLPGGELFYDREIAGQAVRVAAVRVPREGQYLVVQAAETTVKRQTLTRQVLAGIVAVEVILLAAAAVLVWVGIGKGLEPLQRLGREIETRSHRDLRPVSEEQVPVEARSVVLALNNLLGQLAAALRSQEAFVSNAAHQLRTPLTGVRMQVEYALEQQDPLEWRRALTTLAPLTERTVHLVNQLLTLANAQGGGVGRGTEAVDLGHQVEEVAAASMPQAIAKDIDLGLEIEPAVVRGNGFLLRELVFNLLDNAIRYSPRGGAVTMRVFSRGETVLIEVEDEGPGIPPAERANVFRRFYRIDGTAGAGCGLGLAIVAEIAGLHGARVEIRDPRSRGPGTLVIASFRG